MWIIRLAWDALAFLGITGSIAIMYGVAMAPEPINLSLAWVVMPALIAAWVKSEIQWHREANHDK